MSSNNEVHQQEWTLDDLDLDEYDLALAAEILGYPQCDSHGDLHGQPISQAEANFPAASLAFGQEP